jgi:hypothetical protein
VVIVLVLRDGGDAAKRDSQNGEHEISGDSVHSFSFLIRFGLRWMGWLSGGREVCEQETNFLVMKNAEFRWRKQRFNDAVLP